MKRPTATAVGRNARQTAAKCGKDRTREICPDRRESPGNRRESDVDGTRLKIVVSPVRVRVSPSQTPRSRMPPVFTSCGCNATRTSRTMPEIVVSSVRVKRAGCGSTTGVPVRRRRADLLRERAVQYAPSPFCLLFLEPTRAFALIPPGFAHERVLRGHGGGVELVLEVDDLDAALRRVEEAGHALADGLQPRPRRRRDFPIVDPGGYYVRVIIG
jgi:hypothetical protein